MYLSWIRIENFRCFGEGDNSFEISLKPGLTAVVGENDAGKTAVVDAIRYVLGTTDQEWIRVEDTDLDDAILGNSALDRLANASYQITIEGTSYRERLSPHKRRN